MKLTKIGLLPRTACNVTGDGAIAMIINRIKK